MNAEKPPAISRRAANRLCLLAAFVVNLIMTARYLPEGHPMYLIFAEGLGLTLPAAIPAFAAQLWMKQPRVYHAFTLGLSLVMAFGRYSLEFS